MQFVAAEKALYVKIVYYGPALSGKTTNLETIHRLTDPRRRQPLVSLKTEGDRTLFFDLLPFALGQLYGLETRIKLFTVPGQIQYDTTRKQVLAGADGVVFVADSSPTRRQANATMLRYLRANLQSNGLDPERIPLLMQWNKRDLAQVMDTAEMQRELNWRRVPALPAVATVGSGVIEGFREIAVMTLEDLARRAPAVGERMRAEEIRPRLEPIFAEFLAEARRAGAQPVAAPLGRVSGDRSARAGEEREDGSLREHLGLEELLSEAVQGNLEFSERIVSDIGRDQQLARMRRARKALLGYARLAPGAADDEARVKLALRALLAGIEMPRGAVLQAGAKGKALHEIAVQGAARDPLNAIEVAGLGSVAATILERREPYFSGDPVGELLFGQAHPALEGVRSVIAVPLPADRRSDRRAGERLLVVYGEASARDLDADDFEFAQLVAALAAW